MNFFSCSLAFFFFSKIAAKGKNSMAALGRSSLKTEMQIWSQGVS